MDTSPTLPRPQPILQHKPKPIIQIPSKHYKSVAVVTPQPQTRQQSSLQTSATLERQFQKLNLSQQRLAQQTRKRVRLEYLRVSKTGEGQYWIIEKVTRKPFVSEVFDTSKFCWECALELESTFDIQQVIELRPPEAIERIEEMIRHHSDRERVALFWG